MHSILFYPNINYLLVYAFVHQSKHFFILYYKPSNFLFRYYKLDRNIEEIFMTVLRYKVGHN